METLKDVIKADLCLGCGLCNLNFDDKSAKIKLKYSSQKGHKIPSNIDTNSVNAQAAFSICPGKGYQINTEAKTISPGEGYHLDLGYYDKLSVVNGVDPAYRQNASSSGIMIAIANYLIQTKRVDKAIVTRFTYGAKGVTTQTYATSDLNELIDSQGSKYCPVDMSELVEYLKINSSNESYVFIGTPCQIAAFRQIQNKVKDLNIKFFIGNFCGGFKSYNNMNRLISMHKIRPQEVDFFRFRGGGQPGSMEIRSNGKKVNIKYPEYVKTTGYSKLKRCHLCVDATAELADFACGDAWLKEFEDKEPTSIVITRNEKATAILKELEAKNQLKIGQISESDVIKSQRGNIATKKYRQENRLKLYQKLGIKTPALSEGFHQNTNQNLKLELNVMFSHKIKFLAEKLGVFQLIYYKDSVVKKIAFRLFKDNYN